MIVPVAARRQQHAAGFNILAHLFSVAGLLLALGLLSGCAGVKVKAVDGTDYLTQRRGDVLTTGKLSADTRTALQVVGIVEKTCLQALVSCREALQQSTGLDAERRHAALSELWLQQAQRGGLALNDARRVDAYLQSARHAYVYLFHSERAASVRAFEDRQTQVRDYYNFALQQVLTALFEKPLPTWTEQAARSGRFEFEYAGWRIAGSLSDVRLARGRLLPASLLPAASLSFAGLRNQYRRDGLGAEMVAVTGQRVVESNGRDRTLSWHETPFPALTAIARFEGDDAGAILSSQRVEISGYDPYRQARVSVAGQPVPLAANFTSGYGLWLARSGFARQSLLTLFGRGDVLDSPQIYLLQPFDPNRRIVIMLHGLASSPEAWINVANEVLGDETLRQRYQIWHLYYPTNLPVPFNHKAIRDVIVQALQHFDPAGQSAASRDMVLVGHSMGGVLSRLLVSRADEGDWEIFRQHLPQGSQRQLPRKLKPYLTFAPLPMVSRAIFVAAPHRGTAYADRGIPRALASLVRLPVSSVARLKEIGQILVDPAGTSSVSLSRPLNSIDNLSDRDPYIQWAAQLPVSPGVIYHSIMGNDTPDQPLQDSSDGVVPYRSAHLPGAASELVLPSWHSVQETPQAIVEIRRILQAHLEGRVARADAQ